MLGKLVHLLLVNRSPRRVYVFLCDAMLVWNAESGVQVAAFETAGAGQSKSQTNDLCRRITKAIMWWSLTCRRLGTNWSRCKTTEQMTSVFKKLRRGRSELSVSSLLQHARKRAEVPRYRPQRTRDIRRHRRIPWWSPRTRSVPWIGKKWLLAASPLHHEL